jgi:hypothetical protein
MRHPLFSALHAGNNSMLQRIHRWRHSAVIGGINVRDTKSLVGESIIEPVEDADRSQISRGIGFHEALEHAMAFLAFGQT